MKILYANLADTTADGTTLTSDLTADAGYPLGNILNGLRTKAFQVTAPTSAAHYILFDLGSAQAVNAIALINCNQLSGVSLTIQGNASNVWTSPSVSVGIDGAGLSVDGLSSFNYFTGGPYRWWRLSFTPSASLLYLGRVFFGNPLTPSVPFKVGYKDGQTAVSFSSVSIGGQEYIDQRNKYRELALDFTGITDGQKYSEWLPFLNGVGVNRSFVVTLDPSNTTTSGQTSVYGHLKALPTFSHENYLGASNAGAYTHGLQLQIREAV